MAKKKKNKQKKVAVQPMQPPIVPQSFDEKPKVSFYSRYRSWLKKIGVLGGIILVIGVALLVAYTYKQRIDQTKRLSNVEAQQFLTQVGKLIVLPSGTPTIGTVQDISVLHGQPFFANAQNGDKVLIYDTANKAILYRPSLNKIIEVGPIVKSPQKQVVAGSKTSKVIVNPTPDIEYTKQDTTVAIYNGTRIAGLASSTQKVLESKLSNVAVIDTGNASKRNYDKTVVIDLKQKSDVAEKIAKLVNGEVIQQLPDGEATPSANILVIMGKN